MNNISSYMGSFHSEIEKQAIFGWSTAEKQLKARKNSAAHVFKDSSGNYHNRIAVGPQGKEMDKILDTKIDPKRRSDRFKRMKSYSFGQTGVGKVVNATKNISKGVLGGVALAGAIGVGGALYGASKMQPKVQGYGETPTAY